MTGSAVTRASLDKGAGQTNEGRQQGLQQCTGRGPHADILELQRVLGNRAVTEVLLPRTSALPPTHTGRQFLDEAGVNSPGQPLDPVTRVKVESRFGYNFGRVRVHTDAQAVASAHAANAQAYTVGEHIVFGEGRYAPGSAAGRELLVHELTHVVQQQHPGAAPPGVAHEQEAHAAARQASGSAPIAVVHASAGSVPQFAKDPTRVAQTPRIIFLDTNIIQQIVYGNVALETLVEELRAKEGARLYVTQQTYNELIVQPGDPTTVQWNKNTLQRLRVTVGPSGTMAERAEVYTRNIADISGTGPAQVRTRQIAKDDIRPAPVLSEPDLVPEPGKKSKGTRNDVLVAAQVRATGGELLTTDADFLNANKLEKATGPKPLVADPQKGLGVRIAPESFKIRLVPEEVRGGEPSRAAGGTVPGAPSSPPTSATATPTSTVPTPGAPPSGQTQAQPSQGTPAQPSASPATSQTARPQAPPAAAPPQGSPTGASAPSASQTPRARTVLVAGASAPGASSSLPTPTTEPLQPRTGLPALKRPPAAPQGRYLVLYRGTVEPWRTKSSRNVHDTGPGTYYSPDLDIGIDYARQNRADYVKHLQRQMPPGAKVPSGPPGIVLQTVLDRSKVKIFDFYYDQTLRKEWNDFLLRKARVQLPTPPGQPAQYIENPWPGRILSGQPAAERYNDLFNQWIKEKKIDLSKYDAVISPDYRTGGAQVVIRSRRLVKALDRAAQITAIATDRPQRPAAASPRPPGASGNVTPPSAPGGAPSRAQGPGTQTAASVSPPSSARPSQGAQTPAAAGGSKTGAPPPGTGGRAAAPTRPSGRGAPPPSGPASKPPAGKPAAPVVPVQPGAGAQQRSGGPGQLGSGTVARLGTGYVPSAPPLNIGPTPRAQLISTAAVPLLQVVNWILGHFAEEIQRDAALKAVEAAKPDIQKAIEATGQGVLIFLEYTQPWVHPDSVIRPGLQFVGLHWQTGGRQQRAPGTIRPKGETAQFTTIYVAPTQEVASRTDKGAAEYRIDQLWQRFRVYEKAGKSYAREGLVGRFLRERKQDKIDLQALYDARAHLSSARIAIKQERYEAAQTSMDAAEELLNRMLNTFADYTGDETLRPRTPEPKAAPVQQATVESEEDRAQAKAREALVQAARQREAQQAKAAPPPQPAKRPVASSPALLPQSPPAPAAPPLLPGMPARSETQTQVQIAVQNATSWANRLVRRGSRLADRIQTDQPPTAQERQAFKDEESLWRNTVQYVRGECRKQWPEGVDKMNILLEQQGNKLAEIRTILVG